MQNIMISGQEMVLLTLAEYEALLAPAEIDILDYLISLDRDFEEIGEQTQHISLKAARKARRLSQKELAIKVELTQAMISGLEKGSIKGSKETWLKLAKELDISLDYLLA